MLNIILGNKQYKSFIDFASKTCDSVSLVFEKDETDNSQYAFQEIYHIVSESVIKKESIDVHPNTGSCFENADILYLRINTSVTSFLKQANGIFDWNGKKLPEELCFYRDEKIWFSCICHERLLHIHNETSDDLEFLKNSKIKFLYEF